MESIDTFYFLKDSAGSDLPDTDGVKMKLVDGTISTVPNDAGNTDWQLYQDWLAVPNTTQTEP